MSREDDLEHDLFFARLEIERLKKLLKPADSPGENVIRALRRGRGNGLFFQELEHRTRIPREELVMALERLIMDGKVNQVNQNGQLSIFRLSEAA